MYLIIIYVIIKNKQHRKHATLQNVLLLNSRLRNALDSSGKILVLKTFFLKKKKKVFISKYLLTSKNSF